jgi:hypothetical protein
VTERLLPMSDATIGSGCDQGPRFLRAGLRRVVSKPEIGRTITLLVLRDVRTSYLLPPIQIGSHRSSDPNTQNIRPTWKKNLAWP